MFGKWVKIFPRGDRGWFWGWAFDQPLTDEEIAALKFDGYSDSISLSDTPDIKDGGCRITMSEFDYAMTPRQIRERYEIERRLFFPRRSLFVRMWRWLRNE